MSSSFYRFIILSLFIICIQCPLEAQTAKTVSKFIQKQITKSSEQKFIKVMSKGVLKEVPIGKESLKVIRNIDGSYSPVIHNLGKNASNFSDEFNKVLLKERRKAITFDHQFISVAQLERTKPKANLIEKSSRQKLRENIYLRMESEFSEVAKGFGGTEAHHVVEGNAPAAAKSREILKKFGIGINDAENGVLLRSDNESIYRGALHNTSHSPKYSEYVYSKIKEVKSSQELIIRLSEIKESLVNGTLDLAGNVSSPKNKLIF